MTLIIGGAGQGKLAYALRLTGLTLDQVSDDPRCHRPVVTNLAQWLRHTEDPWTALDALLDACPDVCLLCDEVGCGVVPIDPLDRRWRERVGRTCCALAERADRVVRLCCGIPTIIKGA